MSLVNVWLAMSEQAVDAFKDYPDSPMDKETYTTLSCMKDGKVVQGMFPPVTAWAKTYRLFSLYLPGSARVKEALDALGEKWPNHFFVLGAWYMDGRQVGIDEEGAGEPIYPVHAQAYKFMRSKDVYDVNGDVIGTIDPTSNADLEDVNVMTYQSQRRF